MPPGFVGAGSPHLGRGKDSPWHPNLAGRQGQGTGTTRGLWPRQARLSFTPDAVGLVGTGSRRAVQGSVGLRQ